MYLPLFDFEALVQFSILVARHMSGADKRLGSCSAEFGS